MENRNHHVLTKEIPHALIYTHTYTMDIKIGKRVVAGFALIFSAAFLGTFLFVPFLSTPRNQDFTVQLLYEADCPYCKAFIREHICRTYLFNAVYDKLIHVDLLPYGNAHSWENCQHGINECKHNMMEACVLKYATPYDGLHMVCCLENQIGKPITPQQAMTNCANQRLPTPSWKQKVLDCYGEDGNGADGISAIADVASRTPSHDYVPWITLNGPSGGDLVHSTAAEHNLKHRLCELLPTLDRCKESASANKSTHRSKKRSTGPAQGPRSTAPPSVPVPTFQADAPRNAAFHADDGPTEAPAAAVPIPASSIELRSGTPADPHFLPSKSPVINDYGEWIGTRVNGPKREVCLNNWSDEKFSRERTARESTQRPAGEGAKKTKPTEERGTKTTTLMEEFTVMATKPAEETAATAKKHSNDDGRYYVVSMKVSTGETTLKPTEETAGELPRPAAVKKTTMESLKEEEFVDLLLS